MKVFKVYHNITMPPLPKNVQIQSENPSGLFFMSPKGAVFFGVMETDSLEHRIVLKALFEAYSHAYESPSDILNAANNYVCAYFPQTMKVSVILSVLNSISGEITSCNAEHVENSDVLPVTGLALGLESQVYYETRQTTIKANEPFILYTQNKKPALRVTWAPPQSLITNPLYVHFRNEISEITKLHSVVDMFSKQYSIHEKTAFNVKLILEELLVNTISYGYNDHHPHLIYVTMTLKNDIIVVSIEDDGIPFNPLDVPEIDTSTTLEEKTVGGLGIHFVRALTRKMDYERTNEKNIVRLDVKHHT